MMLKLMCSLVLASAGLSVPAAARIGETEVECEARYGKSRELPLEVGGGITAEDSKTWVAKVYSARGLMIEILFDDGIAAFIRYSNEPMIKLAHSAPPAIGLTAPEITRLRTVHLKDGSSWQAFRDASLRALAPNMTLWISSDQALHAGYDRDQKKLFVCSAGFWDLVIGALKNHSGDGASGGAASRFEGL